MDNDIDIYADLPSISLNSEQNAQLCNCKESEKKLGLLTSELENLEKTKKTLENNLSSLLKTAKAEIARKDRMIDSLTKRQLTNSFMKEKSKGSISSIKLDDISFRRNRIHESQGFSTHRTPNQQYDLTEQYENVTVKQEIQSRYQTEVCQDESEKKKIQIDTDTHRAPTIFGERMHKRIVETEEEKQKILRFNGGKEVAEESNKENGSRSSVNNNRNESSVTRNSGTETPYTKNSEKRAIEEDRTYGSKRLKTEDNKDETASEALYHNSVTQCDLKDSLEVKDNFVKFNDRLDVAHSVKKEHAPFNAMHRTASEDTKQSRSGNEWKREERSDYSRKDYDSSRSKKGSVDSWRSYRNTLTSNHVSEGFNDEYKNGHRYSPPRTHSKSPSRRHSKSPSRKYSKSPSRKFSKSPSRKYSKSPSRKYSKSRSDHESSSNHRDLRERSNRTHRDRKYDDYEYNDRYRNGRLKKDYDGKEYDKNKSRYGNREQGDLRDRYKRSLSDVEDNNFHKYKKYQNRRIKESTPNVSDHKKSYESGKTVAAIDTRASFSRNVDVDQNIERKTENEGNIKIANSSESTATRAEVDLNNLEEGELLDSPEKKTTSASILVNSKVVNNNASCRAIENKIKDDSASAPVDDKTNDIISTKVDDKVNKAEGTARLPQADLEDNGKATKTKSSSASDATSDEKHNSTNDDDYVCSLRSSEVLTDDTRDAAPTQQMPDNNDDSCKTRADKKLESAIESPTKIKDTDNSSREEDNKIENLNKFDSKSIESTLKEKEINDPDIESAIKSAELNHIDDDNNNQNTENEKLDNSPVAELTARVETEINNCDTKNNDETEMQNKNEICNAVSDKSDIEMSRLCLSDHNYVRNPAVEPVTDSDAVQKSPVMSDKIVPKTISPRKTKTKEVVDVQSISTSKMTLPAVKSKKNQQAQGIIISRRRRAVTLSDSNASMTVLMNRNVAKTPAVNSSNYNNDDPASKPRLRPASSRGSSKTICK